MNTRTSIEAGYVPPSSDELFESLCKVCDILESLSIPYLLSGGTLLGAIREGDLIHGDSDWDLDVLDEHVDAVIASKALFEEQGLLIDYPLFGDAISFPKVTVNTINCERRVLKISNQSGQFQGDLFIYNLFSDGILRRISIQGETYFNAKMSFPYWYFINRTRAKIRDREFSIPQEAILMLERVYGPRWQTPLDRHAKIKGYNFAGAHTNANIEKTLKAALATGWIPHYPDAPAWPMAINFTSTPTSARWIRRHEHLESTPVDASTLQSLSVDQRNALSLIQYRMKITSLKRKVQKINMSNLALEKDLVSVNAKLKSVRKTLKQKNARIERIESSRPYRFYIKVKKLLRR